MKTKLLIIGVIFLLITGCKNKTQITPTNITDNVYQHTTTSLRLLEQNRINDAKASINRAIKLDPTNSIALSTKAVIENNPQLLKKAKKYIKNKADKFIYYLSNIRLAKNEEEINKYYKLAKEIDTSNLLLPYYKDKGALEYFTAKAYFNLANYEKAREFCSKVFNYKNSKFYEKARKLWEKSDRIIKALGVSKWSLNAKKLAAKDKIKRVDAAVVLVNELNLDKLLKGAFNSYPNKKIKLPEDVKNHPNRYEIEIIYKYNLRGLNNIIKDKKIVFAPNEPITREEFALVLEDIIATYTKDKNYKTKYFGNKSIFVDVKETSPAFNAIMNAVARGFMKANKYGEFRPKDPLSGIELIEAISKIKEELSL